MKTTKEKQTTYSYKTMKSPVGRLKLVASERGLAAILWEMTIRNESHSRCWWKIKTIRCFAKLNAS